ncbi:LOW QUALITY PROTEIN: hypothetical protein QTO34_019261 [Cnephaeus nilssonii]|uniref:RRM domain-containing protein n=1 Tax=Cnephaeus nilssonii TaxID=3371016 RepID=A0AA40HXC0_CNENI|nr:LOW QUALITY PROTEIN: hypothetical protein QTO34_019261 [Eptesicus nilssonii]
MILRPRWFGSVDRVSACGLKGLGFDSIFGNEIELEKPKGNDSKKDRDARTILPYKVPQDELKDVFEDAMEIILVSKGGKTKGITYIEFKTEANAEKALEEKQRTEMDGRSTSLCYMGEEGQNQDHRGRKNSTWSVQEKKLFRKYLRRQLLSKCPRTKLANLKGMHFIQFASFEDVKEALSSCNKREIESRAIRLKLKGPRGFPNARSQPSKTLFVKGLSEETTEETLKESSDGSAQASIDTNHETASSKGLGFTSTVKKTPKPPRRPWKAVKLIKTKLVWTGPSPRVKVALGIEAEAEVVAEEAKVDLVAEAGEVLEVEEDSKEAEEEEITSHKERRRSLNSFFYPSLFLFHLKEGLWSSKCFILGMRPPQRPRVIRNGYACQC